MLEVSNKELCRDSMKAAKSGVTQDYHLYKEKTTE